jgi:hypothetical protein
MGSYFSENRISVWDDGKILEIESGDGYITSV